MPDLTLISTARSGMGSGQAEIATYSDAEGNRWVSLGGGPAVMAQTAAEIAHLKAIGAAAREAGRIARGE